MQLFLFPGIARGQNSCTVVPPQLAIVGGTACNWAAFGFRILNPDSSQTYSWYYDSTLLWANEPGNLDSTQYYSRNIGPATGHYSFYVVAKSACGATASSNVLYNYAALTPVITSGTGSWAICGTTPILLYSSSKTGNEWLVNGQPLDSSGSTLVATRNGDYRLVVTTPAGCSDTSAVETVTADPGPPTPVVTPGGTQTICPGSTLTLSSSSGTGNQWFSGDVPVPGETGSVYYATAAGVYWVQVTDPQGCWAASNNVTVTISSDTAGAKELPVISPAGSVTVCSDTAIYLVCTPAVNFQWFVDSNALPGSNGDTLVVTQSGTYQVATGSAGCGTVGGLSKAVQVVYLSQVVPVITMQNGLLTSNYTDGNQWYWNDSIIRGATHQQYAPQRAGSYRARVEYGVQTIDTTTFQVGAGGCYSQFSLPWMIADSNLAVPQVLVYPNPATTQLTLSSRQAGPVTVRIFDMMGRALYQRQDMTGTVQVDVTNWGKGVYIVQLIDQGTQATGKTVVVKM